MASVHLARTWVNLLSTGQSVSAYTGRGKAVANSSEGEVRRLAGGRYRSVGTVGVRQQQSFALRDVSTDDLATLTSWIGQAVLIRDARGRKMFGVYWTVSTSDRMSPDLFDVGLDVTEITYIGGA